MEKYLFYFLCGSLVSVFTLGCAWIEPWFKRTPPPVTETVQIKTTIVKVPPTPAPPTALTGDAEAALQAAEASIVEARSSRTLWPAAVAELEKARAAAKQLDSTSTIAFAREVVALCTQSRDQRKAARVAP